MKKYLALLLAAIMALSLAACASTAKTEDAASTSGKLTMATNAYFEPWEYYDGENIVGIDPEVAQAIADKLGLTERNVKYRLSCLRQKLRKQLEKEGISV